MSRALAMTAQEAALIRQQVRLGALDLALPGTEAIVRDAERVGAQADLWGVTPHARRHSALATLAITTATVLIVGACMLPWPT